MATTNGILTPPTAPTPSATTTSISPNDTSTNKRKREDDDTHTREEDSAAPKRAQLQNDILEILQRYDTDPSFLNHNFTQLATSKPSQKIVKLSADVDGSTSISRKLSNGSYSQLQALKRDASFVSEQLVTALRVKGKKTEGQGNSRQSVEDLKRIKRIGAFAQLVHEIVEREAKQEMPQKQDIVKQEHSYLTNGYVNEGQEGPSSRSGTVLTLFGNAPTPKQLFSSMQNPPSGKQDAYIRTELPVEEMGLPNGLSATRIVPTATEEAKKGPTFAEAFPPPYNLPQLHPPKAHKRSSTRDNTITWEFKDPSTRGSKRGGWTTQSQTVGDWLGWGGVDPARRSSQEKRKQRDRALSGGESSKEVPDKASSGTQLEMEEEALFRRAYSSFGPTYDDTRALVPAEVKSMLWWNVIGCKRFNEVFADDLALMAGHRLAPAIDPTLLEDQAMVDDVDDDFGRVVEELEELEEQQDAAPRSRTDPEQVLRTISELLETLASHQRIRNASLPPSTTASRTPMSPAPALVSKIGRPDSPSPDEMSIYNKLRHEIAYLVMQLPPYAVAKLNGDQLNDLGVSKLITFEGRDYRGTLEDDQVARLAKYTAAATAAGMASLARPVSSSQSTSSQHYNTTSQRTPAIGANANTRYAQQQTSQYPSSSRTPATAPQFQRSTSSQSLYGTPTAAPQQQKNNYAQPSQYPRPAAPQSAQTNGGQQQYYPQRQGHTPVNYSGGYNPAYSGQTAFAQSAPRSSSTNNFSSSAPLQQFQQRSQLATNASANTANTSAYQNNSATTPSQQAQHTQNFINRTASPASSAKPAAATGYISQPPPQPGMHSMQPRPNYQQYQPQQQPGSGRGTPIHPSSQLQTPVNGGLGQEAGSAQPGVPTVPRVGSGTPQPPTTATTIGSQGAAQTVAQTVQGL